MSEDLRAALKDGIVNVSFIKHNGKPRVMNATLKESYLPQSDNTENTKRNAEVLTVWDLDQNGWRSFRLDSVTEWTPGVVAPVVSETKTKTRPSVSE